MPLSTLAGVAGYNALISRALSLAKAEVTALAPVLVREDGSLDVSGLAGMQPETDEVHEGDVALVARLLGLLVAFIGEALTMQLVRDAWPDATFDGIDSEMEKP